MIPFYQELKVYQEPKGCEVLSRAGSLEPECQRTQYSYGGDREVEFKLMGELRYAGAAFVLCALLLASGCMGGSADPTSWEEADESGQVKDNFMAACVESSTVLSASGENSPESMCECTYTSAREELTFDEFQALDRGLAVTPDPDDLSYEQGQDTTSIWNKYRGIIQDCMNQNS